jgi:hypothetical protein
MGLAADLMKVEMLGVDLVAARLEPINSTLSFLCTGGVYYELYMAPLIS